MAVTEGLRAAKDRQEQVPAPEARHETSLSSRAWAGPWRARCSWPDCVCHWLQLTSSDTPGNRCLARAEPKEETQSLPSELPGYRKCGHILKTRKSQETWDFSAGGWGREGPWSKVTESHSGKASWRRRWVRREAHSRGEDGGVSSGAPECPADAGQESTTSSKEDPHPRVGEGRHFAAQEKLWRLLEVHCHLVKDICKIWK